MLVHQKNTPTPSLLKTELRQLLVLAQSYRERELIRYTAFKASGLTKTGARKHYGLENLTVCVSKVEGSLEEVKRIRECIDDLSRTRGCSTYVNGNCSW